MDIIQEIISSSQLGGLNILIQFSVDSELELPKAIEEVRKRIIEVSGDEPSGWSNEEITSSIRKLNRITRMPINENVFSINLYDLLYKKYGIRAIGKQNIETGEVDKRTLTLIQLVDYEPKYDDKYLNSLIHKAKNNWKGINPDEWLDNLRGGYDA